jgi:protein tyrosine/serine phosphatase
MKQSSPFRTSLLVALALWAAMVRGGDAQARAALPNFGIVSEQLSRGAQPENSGFVELKKLGIDIVVNLRHETDWIARERKLVEAQGMRYVSIPWRGRQNPSTEQVAQFLDVLRDNPDRKVFVHCQRGAERTGVMVASYRMSRERWTPERALTEMGTFHFRAGRFAHLERFVREFPSLLLRDPFLKAAVQTAAVP